MRVITQPDEFPVGDDHVVTIGVYDGVHLGHQAVLRGLGELGSELGAATAVVTFDPHPAEVVRPDSAPKLLTSIEHRLELLAAHGVDTTVVIRFDAEQAEESAENFVQRVLIDGLSARAVVVGSDFRFGRDRAGTTGLLEAMGAESGFAVRGVDLLIRDDHVNEAVSSTAIRRALGGGEVMTAAAMLGRPHELQGTVVRGDQRGRTIGFPTANVAIAPRMAMPADAVYAAWYVRPDGSRHGAAVNVGRRPTFYESAEHSLLEAHLIDWTGDLYGQSARVQFVELLRSEQRFDGLEALEAQLRLDVARAREILDV